MKLLKRIIFHLIFLVIISPIYAQMNICADKADGIKERAIKEVNNHIQLLSVGESGMVQEILNVSDILYNYVQEMYFLYVSTLNVGSDDEAEHVRNIQEDAELYYILRIDQIERLIPDIQFHDIIDKNEISDLPSREVKIIDCPVSVQPLQFDIPSGIVLKKGEEFLIEWTGGNTADTLSIDLVKFDKKGIKKETNNLESYYRNTGYYPDWGLQNIKPGHYKIRMNEVNASESPVWSEEFIVKSKIPKVVVIGVPAVAAGVILYLIFRPPEKEDPVIEPLVPLIEPPFPPFD